MTRAPTLQLACEQQHALARHLLDTLDPPLLGLGDDVEVWDVYRVLVHRRLQHTFEHAFERLSTRTPAAQLDVWFERFLRERGPRSRVLRELPGEWLDFMLALPEEERPLLELLDLARFEWAELSIAYTELSGMPALVELSLDAWLDLHPAHRLLQVQHAVHRLTREDPRAPVPTGLWHLCVYQTQSTEDPTTLELTQLTFDLLTELSTRPQRLTELLPRLVQTHQVTVDASWLEALTELLTDLHRRGLLRAIAGRDAADAAPSSS